MCIVNVPDGIRPHQVAHRKDNGPLEPRRKDDVVPAIRREINEPMVSRLAAELTRTRHAHAC